MEYSECSNRRIPLDGALASWVRCGCCCCQVSSVVSDSVRPHRSQPTRLPRPWDSPGKCAGVGCHFLLQCMKVKSESEVAQSCPTLPDRMDCSPSGSPVPGILQARVLEWVPSPSPHESDTLGLFRLLFSRWVVSHCLGRQGLQHTRLPCSSLSDYLYYTSVQILCTIRTTKFRFKTCFVFGSVITWALSEHSTEHLLLKFLYPSLCLDKKGGWWFECVDVRLVDRSKNVN